MKDVGRRRAGETRERRSDMMNDEGPEAPGGYDKDTRMNKTNPELVKMQDLSYWDSMLRRVWFTGAFTEDSWRGERKEGN
jgi:hypothetical protein